MRNGLKEIIQAYVGTRENAVIEGNFSPEPFGL